MEIPRNQYRARIQEYLSLFPVVAILGPRQIGKTTLAKSLSPDHVFDLENPRDEEALKNPQIVLEGLQGLVMIDEIQRKPELFPLLRYLVDTQVNTRYVILGSANRNLMNRSSESLAGRIAYLELSGLSLQELENRDKEYKDLFLRGGYPRSLLSDSDRLSGIWRKNYIDTILKEDVPLLGFQIPERTLLRFWTMISHYHGQIFNFSELARAFEISDTTVRKYLEILEGIFLIRLLHPYHANVKKRLVKAPKFYIRDSGLFHSLQNIESWNDLIRNPKIGASWENFAIEEVVKCLNLDSDQVYFYRTHAGAEIDLVFRHRGKLIGIECKFSDAPKLTPGSKIAKEDLGLDHLYLIYPGDKSFPIEKDTTGVSIKDIGNYLERSI
ncbi:MAG: ATP-binding protein [Leptospira sp.]|nr:ATP-binding protein [Leptospira sp.]